MSGGKQLYLRLQYPEEIGTIEEGVFDTLLGKLQQSEDLWEYECTLASPITGEDESTDGGIPQAATNGAGRRIMPDGLGISVTKCYYCKTAPAWNPAASVSAPQEATDSATNQFTPSILVEMYFSTNPSDPAKIDRMTTAVRDAVQTCLLNNRKKQMRVNIHILRYSVACSQ